MHNGVFRWVSTHERRLALLGCLVVFAAYVLNAWTPSSYEQTARMLQIAVPGPVFGESRPVRSDEWLVATPYYQIAVASDLGPRDLVSPYHEPLKAFFALPNRTWSMAFTPDLWGFLVLDAAHAFSLHYAVLAAAFLLGFALLLRQLGASPGYAAAVSALLFLSQFVQVWWTSNAPVLALAPWPFVTFLWRGPWFLRLPAIAYAVAAWLIGQLYPPFVIAAGLGLGTVVAAFRMDALRPARLLVAGIGAAIGLAVALAHYGELIATMAATVYPGARRSGGGGAPPLQLLAHLFPNLVTARFEPLGLWPTNACEIGVVGTLLPLAAACFCDHTALWDWARAHRLAVAVWVAGLVLMAAWMVAPIPAQAAPLINLVPPMRMLWGFGLALLIGVALIAGAVAWRITWPRLAAFAGVVLAAWAASKLVLAHPQLKFGRFDVMVLGALAALLAARWLLPLALPARRLMLAALVLTEAATFGRFNPVQSARPIFDAHDSPTLRVFRAYAALNPKGWVVAPGLYGAALNGAGVPAINHTLLRPQPAMFRRAFPGLTPTDFDEDFDRYEHIQPEVRWEPHIPQADLLLMPPGPFAIPLDAATSLAAPTGGPKGRLDQVRSVRLGPRRWGVVASGWFPWRGRADGQSLQVELAEPALGRIVTAQAFRLPRPDVPSAPLNPELAAAGFGLRLEIETAETGEALPDGLLRLAGVDPAIGVRPIRTAAQASNAM